MTELKDGINHVVNMFIKQATLEHRTFDLSLQSDLSQRIADSDVMDKHKELRELFKWLFEQIFEGLSVDVGDLQDKMESLGLIVRVKIPQDELEQYESCIEYETDELYFPWYADEAIASAKQIKCEVV